MEFGKIEKIILIYMGIKFTKTSQFVKRTKLTRELKSFLNRNNDKNFSTILYNSLSRLQYKKGLIYRRKKRVCITKRGRQIAKELLDEIKLKKGGPVTSWSDIIKYL